MVPIADADTYLSTRWGAETWGTTATTDEKTRSLTTAENQIRSAKEWVVPSTYETNFQNAIIEWAWWLYSGGVNDANEDYTNAIGRKKIDVLEWEYRDRYVFPGPIEAQRLLSGYKNPDFDYNMPGGGDSSFSFV